VRALESSLRLAEAHAKLMFHKTVTFEDAVVAISCMELSASLTSPGTDKGLALHSGFPPCAAQHYQEVEQHILGFLQYSRAMVERDILAQSQQTQHAQSSPPKQHEVVLEPHVDLSSIPNTTLGTVVSGAHAPKRKRPDTDTAARHSKPRAHYEPIKPEQKQHHREEQEHGLQPPSPHIHHGISESPPAILGKDKSVFPPLESSQFSSLPNSQLPVDMIPDDFPINSVRLPEYKNDAKDMNMSLVDAQGCHVEDSSGTVSDTDFLWATPFPSLSDSPTVCSGTVRSEQNVSTTDSPKKPIDSRSAPGSLWSQVETGTGHGDGDSLDALLDEDEDILLL